MGSRVLVVADDLSGAGDSGVPFALREMRTLLALDDTGDAEVFVADTDSRHLEPVQAAERVAAALRGHAAGRVVFKKIDSTLRGNLAAEVGAIVEHSDGAGVLLCPASPATGRTVLGGVVHIGGIALHHTDSWAAEVADPPVDIASALKPLAVRHVALASIRGNAAALRAKLAELLAEADVVICDAVAENDLRAVVTAGTAGGRRPHWVGSAGLADALAEQLRPGREVEPPPPVGGRVLAVVGSANDISREQADFLAERVPHIRRLPVRNLLDANAAALARMSEQLRDELATGDVVVTVEGPVDAGSARRVNTALAEVCAPASEHAELLVLTGGETARAVLSRRGVTGLRLLNELEPGVVLARTEPQPGYVITKAGGFGTPETLHRAIAAVRSGRGLG
ncbi:4-hydroxythreonine-4-phosphate dehydrogenase [Saccharopolyspora shandongensis]|uniref:4-hydroxythreonine-4-phosphate dehydrogenase n=1 Tax=Saccharopolyspora shandongensis TaxID=418495 RepID=A0A1H3TJA8_9PSEU|nr:four-carbon acid sugar kinase family protein [Saccharopolyspora shandongensis]SDZ50412.1 4-hydroxythreonine-4-phosphate dehydrogenase [Saccharopolyspora shandongensis]